MSRFRLLLILFLSCAWLYQVNGQWTDDKEVNDRGYITLHHNYLGTNHIDEKYSANYKFGIFSKTGIGFYAGYGEIVQSRPTDNGGFCVMENSSLIGGIQGATARVFENSPIGFGIDFGGVLTNRKKLSIDSDWESYYSKGPGLYVGLDFNAYIIFWKMLRVSIGYYSVGLYKDEYDDSKAVESRLSLGAGIIIPMPGDK